MKFIYVQDDNKDEVIIYAKEKNSLVQNIENIVNQNNYKLNGYNFLGYLENDIVNLNLYDIQRIYVENDKTLVSITNKKYLVKMRLYQLEEILPNNFIKINKSCIINIDYITKFNSSWSGSLLVELKNKEIDYISRRQLKNFKKRMGL